MKKQMGYFTLTAIILLVIMLITTLSLIRSSTTTTLISGNLAFKHAAMQYSDISFAQALTQLNNLVNQEVDIPGQYFATKQPQDVNGLPTTINWGNVPTAVQNQFVLQYVIERLCSGALPIVSTITQCMTYSRSQASSNNVGSQLYTPPPAIYFRVTTKITGPHNSVSYVQEILMK
jgi:type IV pilus assembly protein PilX